MYVKILRLLFLLDNASVQSSNKATNYFKENSLNIMFLPSYCPECAPTEYFFNSVKQKLRNNRLNYQISWRSNQAIKLITESIKRVKNQEIIRYWRSAMHVYKESILDLKQLI